MRGAVHMGGTGVAVEQGSGSGTIVGKVYDTNIWLNEFDLADIKAACLVDSANCF